MNVLVNLVVVTLPAVITGLQTCSSGIETSSMQIMLDVSTTQISTGGGVCSCRLTVSHTTQVEMFPSDWTPQCDTCMTIQKWGKSTQCTNGVVQTGQTNNVNTGEEIWILMVATKPGGRGLSGLVQFKVKQPSLQLTIKCFTPNTNSSTATTPIQTSSTTTTTPSVPTTTVASMKTTPTKPTSADKTTTSATDSTPQGQTATASADTSSRSSAGTTSGSAAASTGSTQATLTPTPGAVTDNTKDPFPGENGGHSAVTILMTSQSLMPIPPTPGSHPEQRSP
ncbi:uncharacterized protein [Haliotis asinina]|uniref:uncharacterized protein n=1 Tax=Haliotis asinina TaxID=109174 RepID=UPI0035321626